MRSLRCPSCGAPVELDEESVVQVCTHCGTNLAPTRHLSLGGSPGRPAGEPVVIDLSGGRRLSPAKALGCGAIVVAGIVALGGLIAWRSIEMQSSIRRSIDSVTRNAQRAATSPRAEGPLPLARLSEPSFAGRHRIDAAPPPGGFAAFDPVVGLPWALALAQRWQSDVKLERIDVERLRPDGTVNVQDDAEADVDYRFVSPRRFEAFRERANLESRAAGDHELWISIERGQVFAYELSIPGAFARDDAAVRLERLTWPKSLPLAEIVPATLRGHRRRDFPEVPFYKGYMIRLEDEGWCWYLSTLSGSPSIPRLRARDGRMWPY